MVDTSGSGHGALASFLSNADVDIVICGGIGSGAQIALSNVGIKLYAGITGNADDAVAKLLAGELGQMPQLLFINDMLGSPFFGRNPVNTFERSGKM